MADTEAGFIIRHETSDSPVHIGGHYHNSHEIIFVKRGRVQFQIMGQMHEAGDNTLIFINSFEEHTSSVISYPYERYYMLMSQEFLNTHIHDPILQSLLKVRPAGFEHIIHPGGNAAEIDGLIQAIYREMKEGQDFKAIAAGSLLNLLLINLYRNHKEHFPINQSRNQFELVNRIQNHIEKNYAERITLRETARLFHIDMYYLSHLFRQITGFTFRDYLLLQRISAARQLLITTGESVTDVCMLSGFNNLNHFIRLFKQKEGITPLQFRKKYTV